MKKLSRMAALLNYNEMRENFLRNFNLYLETVVGEEWFNKGSVKVVVQSAPGML